MRISHPRSCFRKKARGLWYEDLSPKSIKAVPIVSPPLLLTRADFRTAAKTKFASPNLHTGTPAASEQLFSPFWSKVCRLSLINCSRLLLNLPPSHSKTSSSSVLQTAKLAPNLFILAPKLSDPHRPDRFKLFPTVSNIASYRLFSTNSSNIFTNHQLLTITSL
ncbi:hypothetical protein ES703_100515 [subsurface metagenome]